MRALVAYKTGGPLVAHPYNWLGLGVVGSG